MRIYDDNNVPVAPVFEAGDVPVTVPPESMTHYLDGARAGAIAGLWAALRAAEFWGSAPETIQHIEEMIAELEG